MNPQLIRRILDKCEFPGFCFVIDTKDSVLFMQVKCADVCNVTGAPMEWKGRKWMLSEHMVKSEIVQTAFLAVQTAIEHETREKFRFDGQAIFGPHFNVDRMVTLAMDSASLDERK